jgi:capsular exopolysaccharide synthesis family protein
VFHHRGSGGHLQFGVAVAARPAGVPGLWVLTAGRVPPNPTELLGSQRFKDFLASLKEHFDWVLLDTPPVMAVADAPVVAHQTAGVLFVVGAEMTSRRVASKAVEHLAHANSSPILGAVLNRVDLQRNPYYYGLYYRPEYQTYYTRRA